MRRARNTLIVLTIFGAAPVAAQQVDAGTYHQLGHAILREMIEENTTSANGNTSPLVEQLANRFRDRGFAPADVNVVGPTPKNLNLVVRYRGTNVAGTRKPILLLAHLDVVEAKREDWTTNPFQLVEKDGYFYGRGTQDQKGGAAALVTALIRLRQEGWRPDRDIILALTAGEEGGAYNGVDWLIAHRKPLIDAEYVINVDAGGGEMENGKHTLLDVQAAEKVFHSVRLTVTNPGGHSSLPRKDNAIYALARALDRISKYEFPAKPNEVTKSYFAKASVAAAPTVAADMKRVGNGTADAATHARLSRNPFYNALLRTTCVATMLEAGHAENALPQTAKATVNCRMLPGEDASAVEKTLIRVINDTSVHLAPMDTAKPSPASPLRADLLSAIEASVKALWGPLPVVPFMETGATDGLYFRNAGTPVYAFNGLFIANDDNRMHGKDERILVKAFDESLDFTYDLLRRITQ
jgi:acetylornithine deacetylase/succinyl-diaminopimelate desuccinylase-like protein